ncbi:hypothetical protein RF679_15605 [Undibacterium cyanobacteriorum]|uniref:Lipocalin-like domain-containing protein n=1 Tax=Undibacterium cyanobacteriorum TaxID=3073561 RepID=A0ABY9RGR8_9BURK|nr:hypothetical protein [Undibacterium sp. 20NA77.5]WMW80059.1 hypothetical protein RF679_15605 [Undibacterium sp. 20NA77.5]
MLRYLLPVILVLLSACSKDTAPPNVIGTWQYSDDRLLTHMTYRSDKTFETDVTLNGKYLGKASGIWTLTGDTIDYVYTASGLERIPVGTKDRDVVASATPEKIVLKNAGDNYLNYYKVDPQ